MKFLFLALLLVTAYTGKAQVGRDTIMLCEIMKKTYFVKYANGLQTFWTIEPKANLESLDSNSVELTIEDLGTYILTAQYTNEFCTSDPSHMVITVMPCIETTAYIPNAFTPDGDNLNETFGLIGENIRNYRMEIFNRWGQTVFITTDINEAWNGPNPTIANDSFVYAYKITYQDVNLKHYEMYGRITLVR